MTPQQFPNPQQFTDQHPLPRAIPEGLRWSAATAAFQIEGARTEGGRGRSIWDDYVERPRAVKDASVAEPGPDSYHRSHEDVALAAQLGLDRYRFSISWVRVLSGADGAVNREGLDYYSRLVDDLLAADVVPFPTLYHWDLPVHLEAAGGWLSRDTALRFQEYTEVVAAHLGDRVKHWYTVNEPASTALQGYAIGELAPGRQELFGALPAVHHQLLAHGLAVQSLREAGATSVGIPNNHTLVQPLHESEDDLAAASVYDTIHNRIFADPVLLGTYPDLESLGLPPMPVHEGDLDIISQPLDFYGVNFYNPTTVTTAPEGSPLPFDMVPTPGAPVTGFGPEWPIVPSALTKLLVGFRERYGLYLPPFIVAENGASFPEPDALAPGESVDDHERISYLSEHISAVADAIEQGVHVEEYTVWSLLDNFEWADGYTQRFGLTHVDMETGRRTPKASYDWYRRLIDAARA